MHYFQENVTRRVDFRVNVRILIVEARREKEKAKMRDNKAGQTITIKSITCHKCGQVHRVSSGMTAKVGSRCGVPLRRPSNAGKGGWVNCGAKLRPDMAMSQDIQLGDDGLIPRDTFIGIQVFK